MRTTLNIPEDLLDEAMRLSKAATKTMAVVMGLQELIHRKKIEQLRSLRGKVSLDLDLGKSRKRGR
ncbi:MAG: type II toxin-antitoxin system VapB family antitoxin [Planctomycetota bacterium]|jgi:hypothetical protein